MKFLHDLRRVFARRPLQALGLVSAAGVVFVCSLGPTDAQADPNEPIAWQEHFNHSPLGWLDPFEHSPAKLARVYSIGHDGALWFLHARHDYGAKPTPPAMHYGVAFRDHPVPLERVRTLRWRWRALHHPALAPDDDAWLDMAAGIYVIIRPPSLFKGGRGFKFGWLARPGPPGTYQHGILQVPLRDDATSPEWREESVDLCKLYRNEYGSCEGEHVQYIGVVTDADGTKSLSEADYADFELTTH